MLNDCVDLDSLNKAVTLLLSHALGTNANDNLTMVSSILRLFRGFTCCGLTLIDKRRLKSNNALYIDKENGSKNGFLAPKKRL